MITARLVGDDKVIAWLQRRAPGVLERLAAAVPRESIDLQAYIKGSKLSGQVLKTGPSGHLRGSINVGELRITAAAVSQTTGTNVEYAGIHEFGGEIPHPGGTAYFPDKTGQLRFVSNAAARPEMPRTRAHKIPMPERSFLRSGLRDRAAQIKANLLKAAEEGMKA